MQITYIFHSGFLVRTAGYSAVFDYWADPSRESPGSPKLLSLVSPELPLYIFVSHHHKDHFSPAIFGWSRLHPDVRYVLSYDTARFARHYLNPESRYRGAKPDPEKVWVMSPGDMREDSGIRVEAFGSTDTGVSWLVSPRGMDAEQMKRHSIFHAGDLNAWVWIDESTPQEVAEATAAYESVLESIARSTDRIGFCLFPVDSRIGTHWYLGAELIVRRLKIDHFFPMHFTMGDNEEQRQRRIADACAFSLYANPDYGTYIPLTTPYTSYLDNSLPDR